MDISARLTSQELTALSDAEQRFEDASETLITVRKTTPQQDVSRDIGVFQESLMLKNSVDYLEEQAATQPSWQNLSTVLNCEYRLYLINHATPLRYNPFLSHWVEAIERLSKALPQSQPAKIAPSQLIDSIDNHTIRGVRTEFIQSLLQTHNPTQFSHLSPKLFTFNYVSKAVKESFEIAPYVRMLEEEGIYEAAAPSSQGGTVEHNHAAEKSKTLVLNRPRTGDRQQWKQAILDHLEHDSDVAAHELTHLPIELSSLDFLTNLLQDRTLEKLAGEPSAVIRNYLQHALRLAENMGESAATGNPEAENNGSRTRSTDEPDGIDHGREAQIRAIKLLLLFIRNLIRKALLPPESIYFEIQEICVRYVWIKEVRDFRAFIEEGTASEQVTG